ncbi:sensor domain-containing diguanylate cyclase [Aquabacter cavernae]|uniref:GGDEF domain-containing protein n=1 Tax=Aquabacter cavernae TaxID=2496029 RepID=UPI000F8E252A|nr:sensor domain-containing diguanylate cyclase [Aquabacter cavernae]
MKTAGIATQEGQSQHGADGGRRRAGLPTPPLARVLFTGTLAAVVSVLCVVGVVLWQMRQDAWEHARQVSQNLLTTIAGNIDANMRVYSFALDLGASAWEAAEGGRQPPESLHKLLGIIAEKARHLAVVFVLDRNGELISESEQFPPRGGHFADRDYFQVHRDRPGANHFLSAPHLSRLDRGEPFFALSRRLTEPDGTFGGVIVMAIRLSYFSNLFKGVDLGADGEIGIGTRDGTVLMRHPEPGLGAVHANIADKPLFQRMKAEGSGSFVAAVDDVERLYTFAPIPADALVLSVGISVRDILQDWRERALAIGAVTVVLCGALVMFAVLLRRELRRRAAAEADLAFLSLTDGLTGLPNRRHFDQMLQREWRRTGRTNASLALLFIDVDRFKVLNDRYGHARGDEVLKVLARLIDASLRRPGDMAARYGGEEFAVILPDTDAHAALGLADALRSRIAQETGRADSPVPRVTVSIGVNAVGPGTNLSVADLLEGADKALYQAKAAGRNRVAAFA